MSTLVSDRWERDVLVAVIGYLTVVFLGTGLMMAAGQGLFA